MQVVLGRGIGQSSFSTLRPSRFESTGCNEECFPFGDSFGFFLGGSVPSGSFRFLWGTPGLAPRIPLTILSGGVSYLARQKQEMYLCISGPLLRIAVAGYIAFITDYRTRQCNSEC